MHITSEVYRVDSITVIVKWAPRVGAMYHVRVLPHNLTTIMINESTNWQLIIQYNINYSFIVEAVTPCGNTSASVTLTYGEICSHISVIIKQCHIYRY